MRFLEKFDINLPAICASIIDEEVGPMIEKSSRALGEGADLVEFRIDKLRDKPDLERLLETDIPTIVTNRSTEEGGYFQGEEENRISILIRAIKAGTSCIDIELSTSNDLLVETIDTAKRNDTDVIISFHDFNSVPEMQKLMKKSKDMQKIGGDTSKIIGFGKDYEKTLEILRFLIKANEELDIPIISFAMGEKGKFTRVTAPLLGSPITYASIGKRTAPGQMSISEVKEILDKFRD